MLDATFACPDLTTFCRLDELGLEVTGQRVESDRAVLACRVVEPDRWCRRCGCEGAARDSTVRRLAHEPFGWRPTVLLVTVRRYRCSGCGHVWRQDTSQGGRASGEAVAARAAVGVGRAGVSAPDGGPDRRRSGRVVDDRERRCPRRRAASVDQRSAAVRRRHHRRVRRTRVAAHPARRQVRHRDHRPDRDPQRHRPGPAARHGPGPLETGRQSLVGRAAPRHGGTGWRSWPWTASPGSRPPPPRKSRTLSP